MRQNKTKYEPVDTFFFYSSAITLCLCCCVLQSSVCVRVRVRVCVSCCVVLCQFIPAAVALTHTVYGTHLASSLFVVLILTSLSLEPKL